MGGDVWRTNQILWRCSSNAPNSGLPAIGKLVHVPELPVGLCAYTRPGATEAGRQGERKAQDAKEREDTDH